MILLQRATLPVDDSITFIRTRAAGFGPRGAVPNAGFARNFISQLTNPERLAELCATAFQ